MFDFNLYNLLKTAEEDFKKEYRISTLDIILEHNEENKISVRFNHFESKDIEQEILSKILELLTSQNLDYQHGVFYPNPLQVSNVKEGQNITNESTLDCYILRPKSQTN